MANAKLKITIDEDDDDVDVKVKKWTTKEKKDEYVRIDNFSRELDISIEFTDGMPLEGVNPIEIDAGKHERRKIEGSKGTYPYKITTTLSDGAKVVIDPRFIIP